MFFHDLGQWQWRQGLEPGIDLVARNLRLVQFEAPIILDKTSTAVMSSVDRALNLPPRFRVSVAMPSPSLLKRTEKRQKWAVGKSASEGNRHRASCLSAYGPSSTWWTERRENSSYISIVRFKYDVQLNHCSY